MNLRQIDEYQRESPQVNKSASRDVENG